MRLTPRFSIIHGLGLALGLLSAGCGPESSADDHAEGTDTLDEPCPEPVAGVAASYTIELLGFPEIVDGAVVDIDSGFEFEATCTITQLSFAGDQLELVLACEHPDTDSATVTLTTTASGIPAGSSVGDSVSFSATAIGNQGGDAGGGVFRSLSNANYERHVILDDAGLMFAAVRGGLTGSFGSVEVVERYDCPGWSPCSADGDIRGSIGASSGAASVEVDVGEIGSLEAGDSAWDVSLFQAVLGGCHGNSGAFSLVRRP